VFMHINQFSCNSNKENRMVEIFDFDGDSFWIQKCIHDYIYIHIRNDH